MFRIGVAVCVLLCVVLVVSACGEQDGGNGDSPEKAAEEWTQALLEFDGITLGRRTCVIKQGELQNSTFWLSGLMGLSRYLLGQQVELEVDISDVDFDQQCKGKYRAKVAVSGVIRTAVLANYTEGSIRSTYSVVWESGRWKWCGELADPTAWSCESPGPDAPLTQRYTSRDGKLTFRYPDGWAINTDSGMPVLVNDDRAWAWMSSQIPEPESVMIMVVDPQAISRLNNSQPIRDLPTLSRQIAQSLAESMGQPGLNSGDLSEFTLSGRDAVKLYLDVDTQGAALEAILVAVQVTDAEVSGVMALTPRGQMSTFEPVALAITETLTYRGDGAQSSGESWNRPDGGNSEPGQLVISPPLIVPDTSGAPPRTDSDPDEASQKADNLLEEVERYVRKENLNLAGKVGLRGELEDLYVSWERRNVKWDAFMADKLPFMVDLLDYLGDIPNIGGFFRYLGDHLALTVVWLVLIILGGVMSES